MTRTGNGRSLLLTMTAIASVFAAPGWANAHQGSKLHEGNLPMSRLAMESHAAAEHHDHKLDHEEKEATEADDTPEAASDSEAVSDALSRVQSMEDRLADMVGAEIEGDEITEPVKPKIKLHTSDLSYEEFAAARNAAKGAFLDEDDGGAAWIDYSKALLANMMLPEVRSFLGALDLDGDEAVVVAALDRAAELLEGKIPLSENKVFAWDEGSIWRIVEMRRNGEDVSSDDIRRTAADLARQSTPVATALAPEIFGAALKAGDARLAKSILEASLGTTDLAGTPRFLLMQGQLAEMEGRDKNAFDFYMAASEHEGPASVQALLNLAEMALDRDDPNLLPKAKELLMEAHGRWFGDDIALAVMTRLAQVAEELPDLIVALEVIARIEKAFPEAPEAQLAAMRIPVLLRRLASTMNGENYSLEEAIVQVRRLEPKLSEYEGWARLQHAVAHRLSQAGLHEAALAEFERLNEALKRPQGLSRRQLEEIGIQQAESHLELGDKPQAAERLSRLWPRTDDLIRRYILASFRADTPRIMDVKEMVLEGYARDAEVLHEAGMALMRAEKFDDARSIFERLAQMNGTLTREEAVEYARALAWSESNASRDILEASEGSEDLIELEKGISRPLPDLDPLTKETAWEMLDNADNVLKSVDLSKFK